MPRDINGNTTPPLGTIVSSGEKVLPSQHNPMVLDVYAMMSQSLSRDGQGGMRAPLDMGTYPVRNLGTATLPGDAVSLGQVQELIAALGLVPTGAMMMFTGGNVPTGWVRADGRSMSRETYAALWAHAQASGALAGSEGAKTAGQYGPGNGSTTFTIPNLQASTGYFVRAQNAGRGIGSVQEDDNKAHSHGHSMSAAGNHAHVLQTQARGVGGGDVPDAPAWNVKSQAFYGERSVPTSTSGDHVHGLTIGNSGDVEARPKNIAYPFIIKV